MAESKRTFQSAKMDKDIDDRLLPAGTYRDALNVSVEFSEDGNIGALENLKGNELLANQDILGLSPSTNPNATVIGSYAHPEENKIYYFVTGDKTDGIFEYDANTTNGSVVPIILDSTEENVIQEITFAFSDAGVTATIEQNGKITLTANLGSVTAVTPDFAANTSGSTKTLDVQARVRVPSGYANSGEFVVGVVSATQASQTAPGSVETKTAIAVTLNSATLRGALGYNDVGVTATGFYWGYNTAGTALTISELENGGAGITRTTVNIASSDSDFSSAISGLPNSKLISFAAFATNTVGTGTGSVKSLTTSAAPAYNRLPQNKLFIFPAINDEGITALSPYYPGYGDFEKPDGNFYFTVVASKQSGLYTDYDDLRNETGLLSSIGPTTLTFNNAGVTAPNNYTKTRSEYATASTTGLYTITASKTGLTSNSIQIRKGSPSNAVFTSNFTLNFAKTGTGAVPAVAVYDNDSATALHYNASPAPLANFKIGPFEQSHGNGAIMIPIANDTSVASGLHTTSSFTGFDPTKLDVSITGKTEGVDYNYYIAEEAMSIWGSTVLGYAIPAIVVEADPYVLNSATNTVSHTLNITYNY